MFLFLTPTMATMTSRANQQYDNWPSMPRFKVKYTLNSAGAIEAKSVNYINIKEKEYFPHFGKICEQKICIFFSVSTAYLEELCHG